MGEKRIVVESIKIKNFRSIRSEVIAAKDLNIFVGLNDAGKSNILKALNLFFNKQTDYNTDFDFKRDFTYLFPTSSHSTKEIKITIQFLIPDTYKESGVYTWEQVWRTDDYYTETITNSQGEEPTSRSRVPSTLKRIKFRYVPAVKSSDYYKTLLSDLYFTVSSSINSPLHSSTQEFATVLKEYTKAIGENVSKQLDLISELSIPSNLNDIFRALIFITRSEESKISIPLNARGDGIQARHIPIILKYIADEDQKSRNQGSMKVATIWGFEEPENGLELSKTFQMSNEFGEYSKTIQIFVSTHSPAFYMKNKDNNTEVYFVSKKINSEETILTTDKNTNIIGQNMGLMPLVAPFIAEQEEKLRKYKKIYKDNYLTDVNTIMVEGKTDREYLQLAIQLSSESLGKQIELEELRILTREDGCGTTQLVDWALAWLYSGFKSKLFILFDKDDSGKKAKNSIENNDVYKKRNTALIFTQFLQPSDEIIEAMTSGGIDVTFEIEHLLSINFWKMLKTKNLVGPRDDQELFNMINRKITRDKTIDNIIEDSINNIDIRDTIITLNPIEFKKGKILALAKKEIEENPDTTLFNGFKRSIEKLEKIFM